LERIWALFFPDLKVWIYELTALEIELFR